MMCITKYRTMRMNLRVLGRSAKLRLLRSKSRECCLWSVSVFCHAIYATIRLFIWRLRSLLIHTYTTTKIYEHLFGLDLMLNRRLAPFSEAVMNSLTPMMESLLCCSFWSKIISAKLAVICLEMGKTWLTLTLSYFSLCPERWEWETKAAAVAKEKNSYFLHWFLCRQSLFPASLQ